MFMKSISMDPHRPSVGHFRKDLLSILLLAILALTFFWKIVFTDDYTLCGAGDNLTQFYPWYFFSAYSYKLGVVPLWNPYQYSGYPFSGEGQAGIFYPLNIVLSLLPTKAVLDIQAFEGMVVLHFFLAAVSMFAFLRRLQRSSLASIVGALCFAFNGFLIGYATGVVAIVYSSIYMPLIFLCFYEAIAKRNGLWALGAGFFLGISILAGHIQIPIYIALSLFLYALYQGTSGWREEKDFRKLIMSLLVLVICVMIALGIAAIQILPSLEYGRHALRWVGDVEPVRALDKLPYRLTTVYSFPPHIIVALLNPWLHADGNTFYMGILPLILALLGLLFCRHTIPRFFSALALIFFLYTLGGDSLIHGVAYVLVPWLDKAREANRAIYVVHFAVATLAAFGADFLVKPMKKRSKRTFVSILKYLWIALGGMYFIAVSLFLQYEGTGQVKFHHLFFSIILLTGTAGLLLGRSKGFWKPTTFRTLVVAMIVFDLFSIGTAPIRSKYRETDIYPEKFYQETDVIEFLKNHTEYFRVENLGNALPDNFGDVFGLYGTMGVGATAPKDYFEFRSLQWSPPSKIYDLLNVKYLVSREEMAGFGLAFEGNVKVYENESYLPRAWLVHHVEVIRGKDATLQRLQSADFDPRGSVILNEDFDTSRVNETAASGNSACEIAGYWPNRIVLSTNLAKNGFLVLSEVYYPGWKAYVDGKESHIYRANHLLRAVYLDQGVHEVVFIYDPLSFKVGLSITVGTLLIVLLALAVTCWKRKVKGWRSR
jgi:hypothetical protein